MNTSITDNIRFLAIIPARYASTRFPGKPLAMLGGKSIIHRVYERVSKSFSFVYVATDDERIANEVKGFGGKVVMTSPHHKSGTDRCFEAYRKVADSERLSFDVVVNVQGDEPFIADEQLQTVKACFGDSATQIATLVKPFPSGCPFAELQNPNSPKVVLSNDNYALYFSRSVIPYLRSYPQKKWSSHHTFYKHIGLYAYRVDVLAEITQLPLGELEAAESLEQLRWLQSGFSIRVGKTMLETIGIDTPEDLCRAEQFLAAAAQV